MTPSQAPRAAHRRGSASDTKPLPRGIDEGRMADLDIDLAVADGVDGAHPLSDPLGAAAQEAEPDPMAEGRREGDGSHVALVVLGVRGFAGGNEMGAGAETPRWVDRLEADEGRAVRVQERRPRRH